MAKAFLPLKPPLDAVPAHALLTMAVATVMPTPPLAKLQVLLPRRENVHAPLIWLALPDLAL